MKIHCGIFAAGKGKRLKKDFPSIPKPLIKIKDKTLIEYTIDNFLKLNFLKLALLLNNESGKKIVEYLKSKNYSFKAIIFDSKTSFESFFTLANFLKEKNSTVVLSTVDTIINFEDLKNLVNLHIENASYITLGITPLINDEKPLLVEIDESSKLIKSIGKIGKFATNGIYVLSYDAISDIKPSKYNALREFLSSIDFKSKKVNYHIIQKSFDIDDISDLEFLNKNLNQ